MTEKSNVWTIDVHLTVMAGNMTKDDVIQEAERLLSIITDGTDFLNYNIQDAWRSEL